MTLVGQQEDKQAKSLIKPFIQLYYYVFTPNKYHVNQCHQSVIRVSSECVQSVFNNEVISSSSASSVSIFGIFLHLFHL